MGEPSFGAGAMCRIPVGQVDEIGADRLDPEDLHAPVCHPVNGVGGDATEAVEERGRPGSAVVVVAAEEEDVSRPQLLSARGHRGPNLVRAHVMAARVLADVDADRLAAERVERHLLKRCAARLIVAESVDVRRRMVRGDDDLGAEGRVSGRRVGVENVAEDLRWWKERVQLRFARERLREIDDAAGHAATPFLPFLDKPERSGERWRRRSARPSRRSRGWRHRPRPTP